MGEGGCIWVEEGYAMNRGVYVWVEEAVGAQQQMLYKTGFILSH